VAIGLRLTAFGVEKRSPQGCSDISPA